MKYIQHTELIQPFPSLGGVEQDYTQYFQNVFTAKISKDKIISDYASGQLTKRDLSIARFLLQFRFARLEEIAEYLRLFGYLDKEDGTVASLQSVRNRLDKLVHNRIINRFILAEGELNQVPTDALQLYCLDLGGRFLLDHFAVDTNEWRSAENFKSSDIISRALTASHLYLQIIQVLGPDKVQSFRMNPVLPIHRGFYMPTCAFTLIHNDEPRHFLVDIVRKRDIMAVESTPPLFQTRIDRLLSFAYGRNSFWKRDFDSEAGTPPITFFICEDDDMMKRLGRTIHVYGVSRFRMTTDARIQGELATAFCQYSPEFNRLSQVKSAIFSQK